MRVLLLVLAASIALLARAEPRTEPSCAAATGATTLPLIELYTSEGCDSCPPADAWLHTTFPPGNTNAAVLAFHVDYWNSLGWRDRFASAAFSERQRQELAATGRDVVYTPQLLVQ